MLGQVIDIYMKSCLSLTLYTIINSQADYNLNVKDKKNKVSSN